MAGMAAAARFDEGAGIPLIAFLSARMAWSIKDFQRKTYFLSGTRRGHRRGHEKRIGLLASSKDDQRFVAYRSSPAAAACRQAESAENLTAWLRQHFQPRTAEIMRLVFVEGLLVQEAAAVVKITPTRASQIIQRSLTLARQMLVDSDALRPVRLPRG